MTPLRVALLASLVSGSPRADTTPPVGAPPRAGLRLRGVGLAEAVRPTAEAWRLNVVAAGSPAPLTGDFAAADGPGALAALARASGLTATRRGEFHVLSPGPLPPVPARPPFRGTRVDFDLVDAELTDLVRLLGQILKLPGPPRLAQAGTITVHARYVHADALLELVQRLASDGPPTRAEPVEAGCPGRKDPTILTRLWCVAPGTLLAVAIALPARGRPVALVRARPGTAAVLVREGDRLGESAARVVRIEADRILLDGDIVLRLP